jgi:hypothetical protein
MGGFANSWVWCDRALTLIGTASIAVGLLLVGATATPMFRGYDASVAHAFYGTDVLPDAVVAHHRWLLGVIGASVVGWGVAFVALVVGPYRRRELWAWRTLAWSVALWSILDIGVSLLYGVSGEVAFVGVFAAAVAVPLAVSRRAFGRSK